MNETLAKCFTYFEMRILCLNTRQFAVLAICNILIIVGNVITNVIGHVHFDQDKTNFKCYV